MAKITIKADVRTLELITDLIQHGEIVQQGLSYLHDVKPSEASEIVSNIQISEVEEDGK